MSVLWPILNPLRRIPRNAEQISQLLHTETSDVLPCLFVESFSDDGALVLLDGENSVLHGAWNQHAMHLDLSRLADAVSAVDCLLLDVWIPEGIEDDDLGGHVEVQARV